MQENGFNPDLLQVARFATGFSQAQVAEALGVNQNTFSRWESGLRVPSDPEIEGIADYLGRPLSFFYRQERTLAVDAAFMFHRKRAKTKQSALRQLHAKINITRLAIASLLSQLEDWEVRFHRMPVDDTGSATECSKLLRATWQVNKGPIRNLISLIESAGAIVISFDFGTHDIDAVGWWPWDTVPLIFVNSTAPTDRLRFSIAHEIGHLVMHEVPTETMESEADAFASSFLMPDASARVELQDVTATNVWSLKRRWRVSAQCLIRRARDVRRIDDSRYKSLMSYFSRKGWRKCEPHPIDPESPRMLRNILDQFTNGLGYSQEELREVMGSTQDEMSSIFGFVNAKPQLRLVKDLRVSKPR